MTSTPYIPVRVDTRGSINLPADIKSRLGINLGSSVLVRQIGGLVVVIPFQGEAEQASQEDRLNGWVGQQLQVQVADAPIHAASKTATAEAIRLQAARERFEQRMKILEAQKEIALLSKKVPKSQKYAPTQGQPAQEPVPAQGQPDDPIAALRASREAEAQRLLDASLQQASADMAPPAGLPQA